MHSIKWTSDLAYGIGLLVTDGNLSSDKRHVVFTSKDIELVKNIRQIFHATNTSIGKSKNKHSQVYRIQIGNVRLYRSLIEIGLTEKKSLTIGKINIPDHFFIDFLRGHLDGDGSITTYTDTYNTKIKPKYIYHRMFVRFISASKKHIVWLHNKIVDIAKVNGRIHKSKANHLGHSMYIIKFGKKESLRILQQIYKNPDNLCLKRKRNIYERFITKNK
jgi:hypothetical protein